MRIVVEDPNGRERSVPFAVEELTVGRAAASGIRFTDRDVSRRHARFVRSGGGVLVEDLGSRNGTRVNGERLEGRRRLRPGDLVEIGSYLLALAEEGARAAEDRPALTPALPLQALELAELEAAQLARGDGAASAAALPALTALTAESLASLDTTLEAPGPAVGAVEPTLEAPGPAVGAVEPTLEAPGAVVGTVEATLEAPGPVVSAAEATLDVPRGSAGREGAPSRLVWAAAVALGAVASATALALLSR
jgi:pSer/pThr/pTyr-binding forkhead associated (FHA) protein